MAENITNQKFEQMALDCRMSSDMEFEDENYVLSIDGTGFFGMKDLCAIKAKQKSGKTTSIAIMTAAVLKGELFRMKCIVDKPSVAIFDTEQKESDTKKLYDLILKMSGMEEDHDRLEVFSLRKYNKDERMEVIEHVLSTRRPTIAVIDGTVDLIKDFNDPVGSKQLIDRLLQLSSLCNTALVCVLHTNKGDDNHQMRGHLGTMLAQKAGLVLECEKSKDGIFTVSCPDSRHEPVPSWSWTYDDDGNIIQADSILDGIASDRQEQKRLAAKKAKEDKFNERINAVKEYMSNLTDGVVRSELVSALEGVMKLGKSAIQSVLKEMIDRGIVNVSEDKLLSLRTEQIPFEEAIAEDLSEGNNEKEHDPMSFSFIVFSKGLKRVI